MFIYKLARYHQSLERKFDKLEDAIKDAFQDHDSGEAYPKEIVDEKGNVILDNEALLQEFFKMDGYGD